MQVVIEAAYLSTAVKYSWKLFIALTPDRQCLNPCCQNDSSFFALKSTFLIRYNRCLLWRERFLKSTTNTNRGTDLSGIYIGEGFFGKKTSTILNRYYTTPTCLGHIEWVDINNIIL